MALSIRQLILASASPRRRELLQQVGLNPECIPVNVDESAYAAETPNKLVQRLAHLKAETCQRQLRVSAGTTPGAIIIGADTVLDRDGQIVGKPADRADCLATLAHLAEREHRVITGVCVMGVEQDICETIAVSTTVCFGPVSEAQALAYWNSGEPAGKAGGYAIQGLGAQFVEHLSGSYSNVVGLPLYETLNLLKRFGFSLQ